jgi:hypothetical protein
MAAKPTTSYVIGKKYLFKTGLDSFVMGTLKEMYDGDLWLKDARVQIPPSQVDKFISSSGTMPSAPVHSDLIIHQINVQWSVPVK